MQELYSFSCHCFLNLHKLVGFVVNNRKNIPDGSEGQTSWNEGVGRAILPLEAPE